MKAYANSLTPQELKNYKHNVDSIRKLIHMERIKFNLPVKDIAKLADLDNSTIYRIERGENLSSAITLSRIINAIQTLKAKQKGKQNG